MWGADSVYTQETHDDSVYTQETHDDSVYTQMKHMLATSPCTCICTYAYTTPCTCTYMHTFNAHCIHVHTYIHYMYTYLTVCAKRKTKNAQRPPLHPEETVKQVQM
eukprot:Tamp_31238.p2 GENE.Tamp_31238~~Tamp_31238.p2  ORF type:complete len:106 (-),score=0.58 Tamp_31238:328-645(-)